MSFLLSVILGKKGGKWNKVPSSCFSVLSPAHINFEVSPSCLWSNCSFIPQTYIKVRRSQSPPPPTIYTLAGARTLEYMDVPHSLFKCNFSAGTMSVNVKYSPVPGAWQRFLAIPSLVLCYAVHLGKIENINKKSSGAPASYYFCQNEILYSERLNGVLSKCFFLFTDICSLYSLWGRKAFHLATVKLCTPCSQTADRKAWSLKSEMKFHFCCGVKNFFFKLLRWNSWRKSRQKS